MQNDPLYKFKLDWAKRNNMVVWRIHDNWHAMKPDGILVGWNRALGFDKYQLGDDQRMYDIPRRLWANWPDTLRRRSAAAACA